MVLVIETIHCSNINSQVDSKFKSCRRNRFISSDNDDISFDNDDISFDDDDISSDDADDLTAVNQGASTSGPSRKSIRPTL